MNMNAHTVGSKYEATRDLDVAELAKLVRADIKAGIAAGELPGKPAKYSVHIERYAGGRAINVNVSLLPFQTTRSEAMRQAVEARTGQPPSWKTPAASKLEAQLEGVLAQYNYNNSDSRSDYFSYKFSTHVRLNAAPTATDLGEGALSEPPAPPAAPPASPVLVASRPPAPPEPKLELDYSRTVRPRMANGLNPDIVGLILSSIMACGRSLLAPVNFNDITLADATELDRIASDLLVVSHRVNGSGVPERASVFASPASTTATASSTNLRLVPQDES